LLRRDNLATFLLIILTAFDRGRRGDFNIRLLFSRYFPCSIALDAPLFKYVSHIFIQQIYLSILIEYRQTIKICLTMTETRLHLFRDILQNT